MHATRLDHVALLALLAATLLPAHEAAAVPIVRFGVDSGAATTNADAQYALWSADVGAHVLDNLDGIEVGGSPGFGGNVTSSLGNTFSSSDDLLGSQNFSFAVLEGISLRLTQRGGLTDFVWTLERSANAFGFFARNNDGGEISINFDDGTAQTYSFDAADGNGDNAFWGISHLAKGIVSVSVTSTDPGALTSPGTGANSNWDRFVYVPVGEPGSLALGAAAMLVLAAGRAPRRALAV